MKIINLKELLTHPEGTVYAKYEPCIFEEILIKGKTISDADWFHSNLLSVDALHTGEMVKILEDSEKNGKNFQLDLDTEERDGCFEPEQLFAVYEKEDVIQLIQKLKQSLKAYE